VRIGSLTPVGGSGLIIEIHETFRSKTKTGLQYAGAHNKQKVLSFVEHSSGSASRSGRMHLRQHRLQKWCIVPGILRSPARK
jgi:hypothetical protein